MDNDYYNNIHMMSLYHICTQFGGVRKKWKSLVHNGVMFPPEYQPHHIPVLYDGKPIQLPPHSEEVATFYAKYLDTDYVNNNKFNKNFWHDWREILRRDNIDEIQSFDKVDFSLIKKYLDGLKESKLALSDDEKDRLKEEKEAIEAPYKVAIVDDKPQPVGNYKIEPPGIFLGRGDHPKIGKIKQRIYPEDVTINISPDAPIPPTLPGHKWASVIHDRTVDWLASWKDPISDKNKYVWLGAQSDIKAQSDKAKFDLARKLKRKINSIREAIITDMSSTDDHLRQIATAVYLIDTFVLRVGNEKGSDAADTVGATSLRVEHINFLDNDVIKLDFLGKDSVRYLNAVPVLPIAYKNLKEFAAGKSPDDELFDKVNSNDVNKYLQEFMKGLTAKVFRTYNASNSFSKELRKITKKYENYTGDDKMKRLLDEFNKANLKVARLMNHQKKVPKSYADQLEKMNEQINQAMGELKTNPNITPAKVEKLKKKIKALKAKKKVKSETKNIALGTSKINYIDPRITVGFIKKNNIPIDKLFTKALQDKFKWAFDADENFIF
ncbi:MAG: dna topoisomerase 1b [Hyperionvirus sp.]|uniref:DNA topoisomerase 1 n=1 Tax=Hyperionvirus sp. TaxID=2487770 RepID=A0A3G5ACA4_9VIRU|nr:MAG: dna topoisomerase 1b [Hyperionvirus sp.]